MDHYWDNRDEMVRTQIERRGIHDKAVLRALRTVPRHLFVPREVQPQAYSDRPLPIGGRQTISQPFIVAFMTELLSLTPKHRVLEIGTGSGYQTAVLSECAGEVFSVEVISRLHKEANKLLAGLGYSNIHLFNANGRLGLVEHAPFDRIIVTAAGAEIPRALTQQLIEGGIIVAPVGPSGGVQELVLGKKVGNKLRMKHTIAVRFVPLTGAD